MPDGSFRDHVKSWSRFLLGYLLRSASNRRRALVRLPSSIPVMLKRLASPAKCRIDSRSVRSVALIELTRLGDVISSVPAIRAIARHCRDAQVNLVVRDTYSSFLAAALDKVFVHGVKQVSGAEALVCAIDAVRRLEPDLACSLGPGKANAIVTLTSGAPMIAGFLEGNRSATPFMRSNPVETIGIAPERHETYANEPLAARARKVCAVLGIDVAAEPPRVEVPAKVREELERNLQRSGRIPSGEYIVLHPGAAAATRMWPVASFMTLIHRILRDTTMSVVVMGESGEDRSLDQYRALSAEGMRVMTFSSDNLCESATVMAGARLFVGNDSGPLHLACALGVKAIGIFGPADPRQTAPMPIEGDRLVCLYYAMECSPCREGRCTMPSVECLAAIAPDEVFTAVRKICTGESTMGYAVHA